jgi:hypothetical protein
MLTLEEFKEKLIEQVPELDLLEVLNLTTSKLVHAFSDEVEEKYEELLGLLTLPEDQDSEQE